RLEVLGLEIFLLHAAVHFERAQRSDEHCTIGRKPALATLDVDELFAAEIRAEARLGYDVIAELQRRCGGEHRIAAVRDVGERPAMDEGGRAFERLYQIGRERLLEQRGHRPMPLE